VKFLAIPLIVPAPVPVTGVRKPTNERFREVIDNALPGPWPAWEPRATVLAEPEPTPVPVPEPEPNDR
jgi:hypothetical protein